MESLRGAFGIVTGAAQGLGLAIANAYVREGMRVALIDIQADLLKDLAADLNGMAGTEVALPIAADLADADQTLRAAEMALQHFGTPRVLVHNAALLRVRPFEEVTLADWVRENNIITQAAFLLTKAVWGPMKAAGRGSIVYLSSGSALKGFIGESVYCTAKHGQEGLMKTLAMEGEPYNIAVNSATPGAPINTPMSATNYTDDLKARWVDPTVIAPAFVVLARQDAKGITGQRVNAYELAQTLSNA
jgi:NAD(P)-dependent dehydrogenase (short-subunit alcohol dehydrogenase family)